MVTVIEAWMHEWHEHKYECVDYINHGSNQSQVTAPSVLQTLQTNIASISESTGTTLLLMRD